MMRSFRMEIASGTRLGPYEIVSRLGAGGMGEVWKARDTRLDRSVAIKVLPTELAADEQFNARFEREAKAISRLNHPHICTLHDVGRDNGTSYLVMELLEGQSLAERLERGPLPLADVLRIGAEIADALDRAHRSGIVHRDLKPANVMVTRSGAKLLDFGLAKTASIAIGPNDATQEKALTQAGTILGTFQYMAPEQIEGHEADARTDIFALGALLYEAATGKRAFSGKTQASIIASIVAGQPKPVSELQPLIPSALEHIINRCLAKDPEDRWQSARDVAQELRWIAQRPADRAQSRTQVSFAPIALAVLLLGALAAAFYYTKRPAPARAREARVPIPVPANSAVPELMGAPAVAVSSDGRSIAYAVTLNGRTRLFVRRLDAFAPIAIEGTENANGPFFSPDGRSLGFFAEGALHRVDIEGGAVQKICRAPVFRGAAWAPDGMIYFAPSSTTGIFRVPATGGVPRPFTQPDSSVHENSHRWPQLLSDGKHILFTVRTDRIDSFDAARLAVLSLETGKWKTLLEGGTYGRAIADDMLLFARGGNLMTVPFDPASATTSGTPRVALRGILIEGSSGAAHFDANESGVVAYLPTSGFQRSTEFAWIDRKGARSPIATIPKAVHSVQLMPDERRIMMSVVGANNDIWSYDIERGTLTRVTSEPGDDGFGVPCGENQIVFASTHAGGRTMRAAATGGSPATVVFPESSWPGSCSSDGRLLATAVQTASGSVATLVPLDGRGTPRAVAPVNVDSQFPSLSPDGKWIAYAASESGRYEVYVRSLTSDARWQVSIGGGSEPKWAPDGRSIFYKESDGDLFEVAFAPEDAVPINRPRLLFNIPAAVPMGYDVAADGRFLVSRSLASNRDISQINLILNWDAPAEGK